MNERDLIDRNLEYLINSSDIYHDVEVGTKKKKEME